MGCCLHHMISRATRSMDQTGPHNPGCTGVLHSLARQTDTVMAKHRGDGLSRTPNYMGRYKAQREIDIGRMAIRFKVFIKVVL
jgi:hypothetical protein